MDLLGRARWVGVPERHEFPQEKFAEAAPERGGFRMCRVLGIRQGEVARKVSTSSEVRVRDEFV